VFGLTFDFREISAQWGNHPDIMPPNYECKMKPMLNCKFPKNRAPGSTENLNKFVCLRLCFSPLTNHCSGHLRGFILFTQFSTMANTMAAKRNEMKPKTKPKESVSSKGTVAVLLLSRNGHNCVICPMSDGQHGHCWVRVPSFEDRVPRTKDAHNNDSDAGSLRWLTYKCRYVMVSYLSGFFVLFYSICLSVCLHSKKYVNFKNSI